MSYAPAIAAALAANGPSFAWELVPLVRALGVPVRHPRGLARHLGLMPNVVKELAIVRRPFPGQHRMTYQAWRYRLLGSR